MPWNKYILDQFESSRRTGEYDELQYNGAYNSLLFDLFPYQEGYMVGPQKAVDSTMIFLVWHADHPVFFIEIKPAGHIHHVSHRVSADEQMRARFEVLWDRVEIPILYAVSAIGTKLCFYRYPKATRHLEPALTPSNTTMVIDKAPVNRWDVDVLTLQGEQRLREVIDHIKGNVRTEEIRFSSIFLSLIY